ncbi:MAG: hypothetical protein DRQ62_12195 [Gammaproteobacteria bacterium]|nr:MAG: hypothetical protein DRQ62_12195 [Gammaproteobacteria bacterium]
MRSAGFKPLKTRGRLTLGLKQKAMLLRLGVSRQQYQNLESKGNPRLNTLELIAEGLKRELIWNNLMSLVAVLLANPLIFYLLTN